MKIQLATKPLSEIKSDYIYLPVFQNETPEFADQMVKNFLKENEKFGKAFESQLLYSTGRAIVLLGVGKKEEFDFECLQNVIGAAVKLSLKKAKSISIFLPENTLSPEEAGQAVAIGAEVATHDPAALYKSEQEAVKLNALEVVVPRAERGYQDGIKKGQIIAESINLVKRLGDMPANEMTPTYFLETVKKVARENRLKLTILTEAQAKRKGMGAFVGVAQGSDEPSYMIALEYTGDIRSKDKWGLVGKGITFDSGGLSLKPPGGMHEMKYDMLGAATVLGTIVALSKLAVKTNIVSVMAVTENLPGGHAQRPGDIVRTYSGKTAEVLNTDAEGRLVLVDALTFAQRDFKATKLIDLATLTGAIIISLGDFYTGVFGNYEEFTQNFVETASQVGERMWELPMDPVFDEMIKSDMADITNIGHGGSHPGAAGSITAAKFIEAVIEEERPWIHLDIAGTAWDMKPKPYRGVGATGVGLKTLVKLIS